MNYKTLLIAATAAMLLLSGCETDRGTTIQDGLEGNTVEDKIAGYAVFNPKTGEIPYPNSILYAGSIDGTLNISISDSDSPGEQSLKNQLNTLSGFSTTAPIVAPITATLDKNTITQQTVQVYKVQIASKQQPVVVAILETLQSPAQYAATQSGSNLVILPTPPLESDQDYVVVLTNGLKDSRGRVLASDIATSLVLGDTNLTNSESASALEPLRVSNTYTFGALTRYGVDVNDTAVQMWSFRTQKLGATAKAFATDNPTGTMGLQDTGYTSQQMIGADGTDVSGMAGIANVYAGKLSNIPYYLAKASSTHDESPLEKSFVFQSGNALPDINSTIEIPVLATVPNHLAMPDKGWPVVIFQHGITQNRTNVLAISEALAAKGYAAVAIDLPLHGIDDNTSLLHMPTFERTFDLDVVINTTGAKGHDDIIDASGTHYINLISLLTSRDNMRQTTSDLLALQNTFGTIVATDGLTFSTTQIAFVGHSLGTIAPFGYLENSGTALQSVSLAMPGGGIAQLLNNSDTFGPRIEAGLAANGIMPGTSAYESFMIATQTILDDADPINYAKSVGAKQNVFCIEVVGNGTEGTSDQVIPNYVATAPLSGTEPLVLHLGTTNLTADSAPNKTARFLVGDHSSILDPTNSLVATYTMQSQVAGFVESNGISIPVVDTTILKP